MKITILSVAAVIVTLATFLAAGTLVSVKEKGINSSQLLGEKVITSLQQSSFEEYELLFPSLLEFQQVMKRKFKILWQLFIRCPKRLFYPIRKRTDSSFERIVCKA